MTVENVFALLGLLVVVASALFSVYMNLSAKNDRVYQRMDENKEQFYKDFVSKEIHLESMRHIKELYEQKHDGLEDLVKEKLDNLANEIKQLRDLINTKTS